MNRRLTFLSFALIWLWSPSALLAEDAGPRTYIRMDEVEIIGVVEHPEITYIIPKTRVRFTRIPLQRSFAQEMAKIIDPLALEEGIGARILMTDQTEP